LYCGDPLTTVGQRLNHQEIHFNGVDDASGGVRAHLFAEKGSRPIRADRTITAVTALRKFNGSIFFVGRRA
jgi:hypothetical protein